MFAEEGVCADTVTHAPRKSGVQQAEMYGVVDSEVSWSITGRKTRLDAFKYPSRLKCSVIYELKVVTKALLIDRSCWPLGQGCYERRLHDPPASQIHAGHGWI